MKKYLKCSVCGKHDKGKTGTFMSMVCPDCGQRVKNKYGYKLATMCRECCPTKHGTGRGVK